MCSLRVRVAESTTLNADPDAPAPPTAVRRERVWLALAVAVALFAIAGRIHNAFSHPVIRDWDAAAHAVNVLDLRELRLPNLRAWAGTHPPLYYALGAAVWAVLPETVPVHALLRLVSAAAWVGTILLVWWALRGLGFGADAAVAATLLLALPGFVIASGMMTNDALCTFFVTATLVRLLFAPAGEPPLLHVALTAVLAALAAMTKAPGVAAVGMTAAFYAWRCRLRLVPTVRTLLVVGLVTAAIGAPHYGRVLLARAPEQPSSVPKSRYHVPGYDLLSGFSGNEEKETVSLLVLAVLGAQGTPSRAALLHTTLWGDPSDTFLRRDTRALDGALSLAGIVIDLLAIGGVLRLLRRRRDVATRAGVVVVFALLYGAALVVPSVLAPFLILTKTNFIMPLALPAGLALVLGLDGLRGGARVVMRVLVLAAAVGGVVATWYAARPALPVVVDGGASSAAVDTVRHYVADRVTDPIRAAALLAPEAHAAHGLRLLNILRLRSGPERAPTTDEERAFELARARQAWLELYNLMPGIDHVVAALRMTVTAVREQGDAAEVDLRIEAVDPVLPPGVPWMPWPFPPFDQQVDLRRREGVWRIIAVRQDGVSDENALPAFVAHPTRAGLARLRALGWRWDWDDGVEAFGMAAPPETGP